MIKDFTEEKTAEEKYVEFITNYMSEYQEQLKLVDEGGQVLPEFINRALGNLYPIAGSLVGELERLRLYNTKLKRDHQTWFDARYVETKKILLNDGRTRSNPPSQMECSTQLKVEHKEKHLEWMDAIELSDAKVNYLQTMLSFLKKMDGVLTSLANNSRSEMYVLGTSKRLNNSVNRNETEQSKRRKLKDSE